MSLPTRLRRRSQRELDPTEAMMPDPPGSASLQAAGSPNSCSPIGDARWRESVRVTGRVRSVRVQPWADVPTLECTLVDETGGITVVFLGRRKIAGIQPGSRMTVEGVAGAHQERLALLNPDYTLFEP